MRKKKIYIVLSYTGTVLAKIVKLYTKYEFSHVSISLDKKLKKMYSFGRLNPYNPFIGGFVHEGISRGTFKRFSKTKSIIYELEVNNNQYYHIKKKISEINLKKNLYKFNVLGLFAIIFNKRITTNKSFYCAEFVKYILDCSDISINLPSIVKPNDFSKTNILVPIYYGSLKDYKI